MFDPVGKGFADMMKSEADQFISQIVEKEGRSKIVAIRFLELFLLEPIVHPHADEALVVTPPLG